MRLLLPAHTASETWRKACSRWSGALSRILLPCCRYHVGHILGAGSFGIVREVTLRSTDRRYACKTVPKIPRRGNGTPRYLLKLQTEVDAMQQLGSSFDAVHLRVGVAGPSLQDFQAAPPPVLHVACQSCFSA